MRHVANCKNECYQVENALKYCEHTNLRMVHQTLFARLTRQRILRSCNLYVYVAEYTEKLQNFQGPNNSNSRTFKD